ncbi:MAG: hypothetical protein WC145_13340 [Aliarcobacter sp.]|jgi:hypothetical protein
MGRNYDRGYYAERLARDRLLHPRGFVTWRAQASKGPFDVYAARHDVLLMIQVKRTKERIVSQEALTTQCRRDLHGVPEKDKIGLKDIPTPPGVLRQVWLYTDQSAGKDLAGWRYYAVEGDRLIQIPEPVPGWDRQPQDHRWENLAEGLTGGGQP